MYKKVFGLLLSAFFLLPCIVSARTVRLDSATLAMFSSIDNSLKFQNDFFIICFGFVVFVVCLFLFFMLFQFQKKHYFFNK